MLYRTEKRTPYDDEAVEQAERAANLARIMPLVKRATNWNEVLTSLDQNEYSLAVLFKAMTENMPDARVTYVQSDEEKTYTISDEDDIIAVVTVQKNTGDALITSPHTQTVQLIKPNVGNIEHSYTPADTEFCGAILLDVLGDQEFEEITGITKWYYGIYRNCKPASPDWERLIAQRGAVPERIGYVLYDSLYLAANQKLKAAKPDFFTADV